MTIGELKAFQKKAKLPDSTDLFVYDENFDDVVNFRPITCVCVAEDYPSGGDILLLE